MTERIVQRRGYRKGIGGEMTAEFLGTFVLILLGVGSVAVAVVGLPGSGRQAVDFGPANWLIISWGWGLAVVFGVYVAGGISGAHLNPAVTLAFAVRRDFPWRKVVPYWVAQVVGAFVAAALVYATYRWAIDASIKNRVSREMNRWERTRSSPRSPPNISEIRGGVLCSTRSWGPASCFC